MEFEIVIAVLFVIAISLYASMKNKKKKWVTMIENFDIKVEGAGYGIKITQQE